MDMSQQKKKPTYLTKEIKFGTQKLVLFSLDGCTWSSRKNELLEIQERHEREKIKITDIKGGEAEEETKEAKPEEDSNEPFVLATDAEDEEPKAGAKKGKAQAASAKASNRKLPVHKNAKPGKDKVLNANPKRRISSKPQKAKAKTKGKGKKAA